MLGGFGYLSASGNEPSDAPTPGSFGASADGLRLANLRIMIVEDEVFIAMAIEDALASEGANVIGPAMSVSGGLDLLSREAEIDGAILDINLDDGPVFPIAERLRAQGIPIIFHTAYAGSVDLVKAFPDAAICIKPMLNEQLVSLAAARFG